MTCKALKKSENLFTILMAGVLLSAVLVVAFSLLNAFSKAGIL